MAAMPLLMSINRIRLEFKVVNALFVVLSILGINRIRVEFKDYDANIDTNVLAVLIESDWNLKTNDSIHREEDIAY